MSSLKRPASLAFDTPNIQPLVLHGTPLPASETHPLPPWQQSLTDDRGRPKRLHGAFAGGWSAGYHNTVGSKEGWTPASFVSSRTSRHVGPQKGAAVEDFMDEEDLMEREEGRGVETRGVFVGLGGREEGGVAGMDGEYFFRPVGGETMGVKLLQRMGWRVGQGIGAKVQRRARGDREGAELHWFAPEDVGMVGLMRKTDRGGLGFVGEERLGGVEGSVDEEEEMGQHQGRFLQPSRHYPLQAKQQLLRKKNGKVLGAGLLGSDDMEDEEDPYAMGPRISFTRVVGKEDKKKAKVKKKKPLSSGLTTQHQPSPIAQPLRNKSHDARPPLPGFHLVLNPLSTNSDNVKINYAPPTIPPNWKPTRPHLTTSKPNLPVTPHNPTTGATPLDSPSLSDKKSIFDFLSPATRDRLAAATQNPHLPPGKGEKGGGGGLAALRDDKDEIFQRQRNPDLAPQTAAAALQRVRAEGGGPYADDSGKRERYIAFLTAVCAGEADAMRGEEGWEFAQAALVFRPPVAGGVMGARFTTASAASSSSPSPASGVDGKKVGEEDAAMQAAKLGMFGPLTRSRVGFEPGRLVCKRFGVKGPPAVGGNGQQGEEVVVGAGKASLARILGWTHPPPRGEEEVVGDGVGLNGASVIRRAEGTRPARVDAERNEALEERRAGEAVFRAIFGSDDENED